MVQKTSPTVYSRDNGDMSNKKEIRSLREIKGYIFFFFRFNFACSLVAEQPADPVGLREKKIST